MEQPESPTEETTDEKEFEVLRRRVAQLELLTGLPPPSASLSERVRLWLVRTVHGSLHVFGAKASTAIATVVLLANLAFIVGFTAYQRRKGCVGNSSNFQGELPKVVIQELFQKDRVGSFLFQEIFLCTSETMLFYEDKVLDHDPDFLGEVAADPDDNLIVQDGNVYYARPEYVACTLPGFSYQDYDLDSYACPDPTNFVKLERLPHGCTYDDDQYIQLPRSDDDFFDGQFLPPDCPDGRPQRVCVGNVSVSYYTCPMLLTVLGASLGYLALVDAIVIAFCVALYLQCSGTRFTYTELVNAFVLDPEQGASSERSRKTVADSSSTSSPQKDQSSDDEKVDPNDPSGSLTFPRITI